VRVRGRVRHVVAICAVWLVLAACESHAATRILFVGNSFTYVNGGIDARLGRMAPSSKASRLGMPGYTLEQHWKDGEALRAIREGGWGYVVLQEQSQTPVLASGKFREYAREFDREIRRSGASTILLMTWERPDSVGYGVTSAGLVAAFTAVGAELGVKVAPAGLAFARSLRERPSLLLYSQDGHPTRYGTYLAACVLYGTIFGARVAGTPPELDGGVPVELQDYLQRIADETLTGR
jgi:hypothetical protein